MTDSLEKMEKDKKWKKKKKKKDGKPKTIQAEKSVNEKMVISEEEKLWAITEWR